MGAIARKPRTHFVARSERPVTAPRVQQRQANASQSRTASVAVLARHVTVRCLLCWATSQTPLSFDVWYRQVTGAVSSSSPNAAQQPKSSGAAATAASQRWVFLWLLLMLASVPAELMTH